jgi:hypothetical protein
LKYRSNFYPRPSPRHDTLNPAHDVEAEKENHMGWGRYLLLGDLGQQLDLQDIRSAFDEQDERDRTQEETIQTLWRENQQLKLAVTAISRLLLRKNVATAEELEQISRAIDG